MLHSTITKKGQTTIPGQVRAALGARPGDKLTYELQGGQVTLRLHPGTRSLLGSLASAKGQSMSFKAIRHAAAKNRLVQSRNKRR